MRHGRAGQQLDASRAGARTHEASVSRPLSDLCATGGLEGPEWDEAYAAQAALAMRPLTPPRPLVAVRAEPHAPAALLAPDRVTQVEAEDDDDAENFVWGREFYEQARADHARHAPIVQPPVVRARRTLTPALLYGLPRTQTGWSIPKEPKPAQKKKKWYRNL